MTGTPALALALIREMARAFPRTGWDEASRRWDLPTRLQELAGLPGAHLVACLDACGVTRAEAVDAFVLGKPGANYRTPKAPEAVRGPQVPRPACKPSLPAAAPPAPAQPPAPPAPRQPAKPRAAKPPPPQSQDTLF